MTRRSALLLSALPFVSAGYGYQGEQQRVSPHKTVAVDLGGKKITIVYGRPSLKGRELGKLTPDGEVWRLGADEATKITVTAATKFEKGPELQPGSYSLFAITSPQKWTMIVNKTADQWGAFNYAQAQDLARFDLPVHKPSSFVEEFTISLEKQSSDTAKLTLTWGNEAVSTTLR